ncbi:MAG: hypothetical protein ABSA93_06010 [Streptosporangiaceae bacterium]
MTGGGASGAWAAPFWVGGAAGVNDGEAVGKVGRTRRGNEPGAAPGVPDAASETPGDAPGAPGALVRSFEEPSLSQGAVIAALHECPMGR